MPINSMKTFSISMGGRYHTSTTMAQEVIIIKR